MSNEVVAAASSSRLANAVRAIDRSFPVLWIGLCFLLPVSGWSGEMFASWEDQRRFVTTLRAVLEQGQAADIRDNVIGPAYIAAAAAIHAVTRLSPEDSLIVLNRASYALSVAAGLVVTRVLVARWIRASPVASLSAQLVFVALVFAAATWYWSDVPWTHFFAMFLAVGLFAVRFAPTRLTVLTAAGTGALLALLAGTRSFELLAIVLAWGIAAVAFPLLRLAPPAFPDFRRLAVGAATFLATTAVVYLATGKRGVFLLYSESIDRQAGTVGGSELVEPPTLALELLPVKLVQLFVDPCYLSLCEVSGYETGGGGGQNVDLWSLPLAVQLPALVLLPACIVGVAFILAVAVRRRDTQQAAREVRVLVEMTLVATALVLGYAASTRTGPAHLRYGFARDFLLPDLLTSIVATSLVAYLGWWLLSSRTSARLSSDVLFVGFAAVVAVLVVSLSAYGRSSGLPRLEGRHIASLTYEADCVSGRCAVRIRARNPDGSRLSIPEASTLAFGCGSDTAAFTVYSARPDLGFSLPRPCTDPRLVAAWPTVMGLPPGAFELAAVDVRNV